MTNKQIARLLTETASLIELTGGNSFRARAFSNAARTIERMEEQVSDLVRTEELTSVRGIGQGLADQIEELIKTGSFDLRDELLGSIPPGVLEMLRVKGIGAKKARTAWQTLNITSVDELEQAASIGRLADLPGFGAKTQEKVLASVQAYRRYRSARRYAPVISEVLPLLDDLRALSGVARAEVSGSLRRKSEIVATADILVAGDVEVAARSLAERFEESDTGMPDTRLFRGEVADGLPLQITVVPPERFGTEWWLNTGSTSHIERFRADYGDPGVEGTEEELFRRFGLAVIPPELREGNDELDRAHRRDLPNLITLDDLKGSIHNHSTYSDGAHSLSEMADAASAMGLEYFGICDHSRSLTIANGMPVERVQKQQAEIAALNERYAASGSSFRIFAGIESDILADGSLDYSEEILATFDFVVASVHSGFRMTEAEATARIIRAVENPFTYVLGHMTGRLLLSRDGYPVDHRRIIEACAANGVAIELNANPHRLDMDWRWIREATDRGVLISINPDAHSVDELYNVQWGIAVARKGWLTAEQCLNARSIDGFRAWIADRRAHASS